MIRIYKTTFLAILIIQLANAALAQSTWFVKSNALPAGTGASWDDPVPLARALQLAVNGDIIHVAAGTYFPSLTEVYGDTTGISKRATFAINPGVTLYGGYPAAATGTALTGRTLFASTILNGDLLGNDGANFANRGDNSLHVVIINSSTAGLPTTIDGFLVRGGNGSYLGPVNQPQPVGGTEEGGFIGGSGGSYTFGTYHGLHGNGMLVLNNDNATQSQVNIRNCTVTDNQANQGSNNSQNGHSQARGAGISVENNLQEGCNIRVVITKTNVTANRTVDSLIQSTANDPTSSVAGIYVMSGVTAVSGSSVLMMDSCLIDGNIHIGAGPSTRTRYGAGIRLASAATTSLISHTTISNNSVVSASGNGYGAGLDIYAPLRIDSSEIINNSIDLANGFGVGAGAQFGRTTNNPVYTMANTTVAGNTINTPTSTAYGVGLYLFATTTILNSTISSNRVIVATNNQGSGFAATSPVLTLTNTTVAYNVGSPGAFIDGVGTFTLDNTLFAANLQASGLPGDIAYKGTVVKNISYSIADSLYYATGIADSTRLTVFPTLDVLADNGGFGQTHLLTNVCANTNPAINSGNPAYRGTKDQDLVTRFAAPWNPAIGATEYPLRADTAITTYACVATIQWNAADLFGRSLTYSILNPALASIDQSGLITPIATGTTKVQVTNGVETICATLVLQPCVTISGQIWNDGNGDAIKQEPYLFYFGGPLYVALYQPSVSQNVLDYATVDLNNGTYTMPGGVVPITGDYALRLVVQSQPVIGSPVPPAATDLEFFSQFKYIGESKDGIPELPGDAELIFSSTLLTVTNYDFGIDNIPKAHPQLVTGLTDADFPNTSLPGYRGIPYSSLFPQYPLEADDIEDCAVCIAGQGMAEFIIEGILPNTRVFFLGAEVFPGFQLPFNFDPADIVIYGQLGSGAVGNDIGFDYSMRDRAQVQGFPATYRLQTLTALPVKFVSFTAVASGNEAVLSWSTSEEMNSLRYDIEQSIDGVNYHKIGEVKAAGNSSVVNNYQYTDQHLNEYGSNTVYYRLKQVDVNGRFTYSAIRFLRLDRSNNTLKAFPVPFGDRMVIELPTAVTGLVQLTLADLNGRIVVNKRERINTLQGNISLSGLSELPAGSYILTIRNEQYVKSIKVVKK